MEEFVFNLDSLGLNYYYQFGHTALQVFDFRKYQRMLRHIKKDAIQKGDPNEGEAKKKTTEPVITYERPDPWCTLDAFPVLLSVFDMDNFMDNQFVEKMLTVFKPRPTDKVGYVYVLQR